MHKLVQSIEQWYQKNKRALPWRADCDPYQIWLSEVMSQQTTMKAILPYYSRFMAEFPTLQDFARADLGEVLKLWTGLGYPSRARNLHKAAQTVLASGYPKTYEEWLELPGVGPYTAAAVSSIAFNEVKGVVDGNVVRFVSRYLGEEFLHWLPRGRNQIQEVMDNWIQEAQSPGDFNQAIMELGATVCTKIKPICGHCPVNEGCRGLALDLVAKLPVSKPPFKIQQWEVTFLIIENGNTFWVQQQPTDLPFLKGQWTFPMSIKVVERRPSKIDFVHTITKNKIYGLVQVVHVTNCPTRLGAGQWWSKDKLLSASPFSILEKALSVSQNHTS